MAMIFFFLENKVGTQRKRHKLNTKNQAVCWFLYIFHLVKSVFLNPFFFVLGFLLNFFLLFTNTCFSIAITIHLEMTEILFEDHRFF